MFLTTLNIHWMDSILFHIFGLFTTSIEMNRIPKQKLLRQDWVEVELVSFQLDHHTGHVPLVYH